VKPLFRWLGKKPSNEGIGVGISGGKSDVMGDIVGGNKVIIHSTPVEIYETDAEVQVKLIQDYRDEDLLRGLELYNRRIPEDERFEPPDIIRWLREGQEAEFKGVAEAGNFCVVAKKNAMVCGFVLIHFYPRLRLAFVAYLVAEKGVSFQMATVSQKVLDFVFQSFGREENLKSCSTFLFEADDPVLARTPKERNHCLARLRVFCTLAERIGLTPKAFDFDYRQPSVVIPAGSDFGKEVPMLLMSAGPSTRERGWVSKDELTEQLDFIHNELYPRDFSDVQEEDQQYREYTAKLYRAQTRNLPPQVRALSFTQIRQRTSRPTVNLEMASGKGTE
jgi:hypothetical protein